MAKSCNLKGIQASGRWMAQGHVWACLPEVPLQINKSTVDCSSAVSGIRFTSVDIEELRGMDFHRLKQKHQSSEQLKN